MDVEKVLKVLAIVFGLAIEAILYKLFVFDTLLPLIGNVFLQWLLGIVIGVGLIVGDAWTLVKLFSTSTDVE
jgi:hypothetical protein